MDLDFNQDQVLLRDSVSGMCSQFSNLIEVRSIEGTEPGYSQLFWQQLIDLGITGMNIPEMYGGLEMSLFDSLIILENDPYGDQGGQFGDCLCIAASTCINKSS